MDYAAPGFYRKNGMWYQQVVGGKDMPYIVCGPGPAPDPMIIGPPGFIKRRHHPPLVELLLYIKVDEGERRGLDDLIAGWDNCVKNQKEAPLPENQKFR